MNSNNFRSGDVVIYSFDEYLYEFVLDRSWYHGRFWSVKFATGLNPKSVNFLEAHSKNVTAPRYPTKCLTHKNIWNSPLAKALREVNEMEIA